MLALPALLCGVLAADPAPSTSPSDEPAAYRGGLAAPSYNADWTAGPAETPWVPRPGDVVLFASDKPRAYGYYLFGQTGPPSHVGMVVTMPDGRPGIFESGGNDNWRISLTEANERLASYPGRVWVRQRFVPPTPDQSRMLSEFASMVLGLRYPFLRAIGHGFMIRPRGPMRTFFMGGPVGLRDGYICGELVVEALAYAGMIDSITARPSATYPRDLFKDASLNLYIHRRPPLKCGWERPARWVPCSVSCYTPRGQMPDAAVVPVAYFDPLGGSPIPLPPGEPRQLWEHLVQPWPFTASR